MKRFFGIALISFSVSILLLHSFVPHHHSPGNFNLSEILKNEPVKSPIDLLRVGFHLNLGANHLENFQKSNSVVAEKKSADKEEIQYFDFILLGANHHYSFLENSLKPFPYRNSRQIHIGFKSSFNYRGPPIFA